jgi:hypothetical protein
VRRFHARTVNEHAATTAFAQPAAAGEGFAAPPAPASEWRAWALACALGAAGLAVLVAVLAGALPGASAPPAAPPAVLVTAPTPQRGAAGTTAHTSRSAQRIVAAPTLAQQQLDARRFSAAPQVHIARRWIEGFSPIYSTAQATFGVNWLLIASIHMQETAFSTAPSTYYGLNFAHCCGGPMQFNVTNRPVTTWSLVSDSFRYGRRPASYDHMTARHPSIYDDFDSIMAAAHLLSADGAGYRLDYSAWLAAYDYYGHDATGVTYADQVLARAIGWSQHGFCINCGVSESLVQAVHAAYGAPMLATLARPALRRARLTRRRAAGAQAASA